VNKAGYTSGWQRVGVWQVPGSPAVQITMCGQNPARGVNTGGIYDPVTFTITDTSGYANLGVTNVLIADFIDGRVACYLAYAQGSNTLYLVDDAGDGGGPFAGSMVLNGTGSIENSQCRIDGAGSSFTGSGTTGTLTLNVFFKEGFTGNHAVYSAARDSADGNNTGWQALGTWSVQ
jgi:large repetitive protein